MKIDGDPTVGNGSNRQSSCRYSERGVARNRCARMCPAAARANEVSRVDAARLAVKPLDMRAGVDKTLELNQRGKCTFKSVSMLDVRIVSEVT
jgi:hypothetical protein